MKIYIIKTCIRKDKNVTFELQKDKVWYNIYAVKTKEEAMRDIKKLQNQAKETYKETSYAAVYRYEEINLY